MQTSSEWVKLKCFEGTAHQLQNLFSTVKHHCFPASGSGHFAITEATMNSKVYQYIL
uniref:Uncharacterized protein n=1 Tax=Sinocyclocheilus anshuiensis TaxID=1608454 RepID=A0A671PGC3_9TELE